MWVQTEQASCSSGQSTPQEAEGGLLEQTSYKQLPLVLPLLSSLEDVNRIHDKVGGLKEKSH